MGRNVFSSKKALFGGSIAPACEYCGHGRPATDQKMILCKKRGVVSPYYKCRRFLYDPLKRKPRQRPKLPAFSPEDFKL